MNVVNKDNKAATDYGQAEGHGGVVGPLAGRQAERPTTDHVDDRRERPGTFELQRGPQGIAHGEAEEAAAVAVTEMYGAPLSSPAIRRMPDHPVGAAQAFELHHGDIEHTEEIPGLILIGRGPAAHPPSEG